MTVNNEHTTEYRAGQGWPPKLLKQGPSYWLPRHTEEEEEEEEEEEDEGEFRHPLHTL